MAANLKQISLDEIQKYVGKTITMVNSDGRTIEIDCKATENGGFRLLREKGDSTIYYQLTGNNDDSIKYFINE